MSLKSFSVLLNSKIKPFKKKIIVDSDKSTSIRSFLIGSVSQGVSSVKNVLESDDVNSAIVACKKLGVKIKKIKSGYYKIYGKGLGSFRAKKNTTLNFGNSGTLARLLIGFLATTPNINVQVKGDHSLNKRSMKKLISLMSKFGATFKPKNKNNFPLRIISSKMPIGITYKTESSAQLKSAVIFAGLNANGTTIVKDKSGSRDHTENILKINPQAIKFKKGKNNLIKIFGKKYLNPINLEICGDPSSAAFFTALTLLNKKSFIKIKNVGLNPKRIGFYEILKKQNAKIKTMNIKKINNELRGDLLVKSCKLSPINAPAKIYSRTTDEYLILFVLAALSKGVSTFKGISDLANKESSRAHEMKKILSQIGIKCKLNKNEMKIYGKGMFDATGKKITVGNLGDHRISMCAFILAILTNAKTTIKNFETVFTSSPSFLNIMRFLGAKFEIKR